MTTATTINALKIRAALGRKQYQAPEQFGPDGWRLTHTGGDGSVIVTAFEWEGREWIHASMTRQDATPSYDDLKQLHRAVFGDGWAYQVFAPDAGHVNIHEYALHLWGTAAVHRQLCPTGAVRIREC